MGGRARGEALAEILGHRFVRPELLDEALTHPSLGARKGGRKRQTFNYERLEFLGDRVLGLIVAELLFAAFPDEAEGALTRRQAHLVGRETLAEVGREAGLGAFLLLPDSEAETGIRERENALADTCEAVIGALYLDGGLPAARHFIGRHWSVRVTHHSTPPHDPKTALQEWAQARGLPLPRYEIMAEAGPAHARRFHVRVVVEGGRSAEAEGASKRSAQSAAARKLLEALAGDR